MSAETASPLSYTVSVARLPVRGMQVEIAADAEQRQAFAKAHGLLSVETLGAELLVARWKRDGVRVSGTVRARISQACVVTLEPLEDTLEQPVDAVFVPEGSRLAPGGTEGEMLLDAEGPDPPETFAGDRLDVGALVEEILALGIEPYPRAPGVDLPAHGDEEPETQDEGPMAESLRKLRHGR